MYDEVHYHEGRGPAKVLQLNHHVTAAELGILIAAAMPDSATQQSAAVNAPSLDLIKWPWTDAALTARLAEARSILALRTLPLAATPQHTVQPGSRSA
jgi:hypothetical protein